MRRALAFVLTLAAAVAFAPSGRATRPAVADEVNRAVVVVDLGNGEVRSACVRFRQQSITGLDLLRAARMDPVVQTYAGQGGAVCKLCGVGCNAGSSCLTCQSPRYWQYWRSDGGTGTYTYSQAGAGNTAVTDGDVDGWSWSGGEDPPPFLTVAEACSGPNVYDYQPSSSAPASTTTTSNVTSTSTVAAPVTSAARSTTTSSLAMGAVSATTVARPLPSTTALPPSTTATTDAPDTLAAGAARDGDVPEPEAPRSSLPGLVAFAAVLAAVVGWTARLRRAGRRGDAGDGSRT